MRIGLAWRASQTAVETGVGVLLSPEEGLIVLQGPREAGGYQQPAETAHAGCSGGRGGRAVDFYWGWRVLSRCKEWAFLAWAKAW